MLEVLPTLMSNFNVESFKKLNVNVDPFIPDLKGGSCTEKLSLTMYGATENSSTPMSWNVFISHLKKEPFS